MTVRSPRLLATGLALLAAGASLAALLHHDGEVGLSGSPDAVERGETLGVKGTLVPWSQPIHSDAYAGVVRHLANVTFEVRQGDADVLVLATFAADPGAATLETYVVEGPVAYTGALAGHRVVVLREPELDDPLWFR